jgi:hypothetical protein
VGRHPRSGDDERDIQWCLFEIIQEFLQSGIIELFRTSPDELDLSHGENLVPDLKKVCLLMMIARDY